MRAFKLNNEASMIPRFQKLITVFWPSFLMAGLGTILFFTAIDPGELISPAWLTRLTRLEIYTLGFLFLWVLGIMACFLTCYFQSPQDKICMKAPYCKDTQPPA